MRARRRWFLAKYRGWPVWLRHLIFPLLLPISCYFPLLFFGALGTAIVLSTLKIFELLPLYSWSRIGLVATSFFWYPILAGYLLVIAETLLRLNRSWRSDSRR